MLLSQLRQRLLKNLRKEGIKKEDIGREKFLRAVYGTGRSSTVVVLLNSLRRLVLHVTGTESVLRWTRAVLRQLRKFS